MRKKNNPTDKAFKNILERRLDPDFSSVLNTHTFFRFTRLMNILSKVYYKERERIIKKKKINNKLTFMKENRDMIAKIFKRLRIAVLDEYLSHFKVKLFIAIKKARDGSDWYLFKLIKFDKCWLYLNWVQKRILKAQEEDDKTFFDDLSDAIKIKRKSRLIIKYKDEAHLIKQIPKLAELIFLFDNEKEFRDILFEFVFHNVHNGILPKLDIITDKVYFKEYLKRHNL